MDLWICTKCGNEFPDEQARRIPDRFSMYGCLAIGGVLLVLGLVSIWSYIWSQYQLGAGDIRMIIFGGMLIVFSVFLIRGGLKCGKEATRRVCPACESTWCADVSSKAGEEIRAKWAARGKQD